MRLIAMLWCLIPLFLCGQFKVKTFGEPAIPGNEPSISIDPNDADNIWLAFNNNHVYHSLNGGKQWLDIKVNPPQGFYGDPVIHVTSAGVVYLAHLAKNPKKSYPESFDCIVFERSTNGVEFHSKAIGKNGKMQDKPWIAVDEWIESRFKNSVYLSWTEFDKYGSKESGDSSRIRFCFSRDYGATFSDPVVISDMCGDAKDGDRTAEGATIGILKNGTLCCVWSRNDTLWYDLSRDGGETWGKDQVLSSMKGGWSMDQVQGMMRTNGMPFVTHDKKGKLYVIYAAENARGDANIYYHVYHPKRERFSQAIKINDDHGQRSQFCPFVKIDQNTGYPRVIWYDKRNSETGRFCQVYTAELKNQRVSPNHCLTNVPIPLTGNDKFYGDYIGFDTHKGQGGRAVFTGYDFQTNQNVIQLAQWKKKHPKRCKAAPCIVINPNDDSDSAIFMIQMPGETSCTFEIKTGRFTKVQKVFLSDTDKGFGSDDFIEVYVNKQALPSGVYNVILRRKNLMVKKRYWVE